MTTEQLRHSLPESEFLEQYADYLLFPWDIQNQTSLALGFSALLQSWGSEVSAKQLTPQWDDGGAEIRERRKQMEIELFHAAVIERNNRFKED